MMHLITEQPLDVARAMQLVADPAFGAIASFVGVVRDHNLGQRVEAVTYDAFAPLCMQVFTELAREAGEDVRVAIHHRLGRVAVGEASVIVVAASVHRREALQATQRVIDALKHRAPIWKLEHYATATAVGCLGIRSANMLELTTVDTAHPLYAAALELRFQVLRAPLGMTRDTLPTPDEHLGPHIVATDGGAVVGTVSLRPLSLTVGKLYQMAVAPELQGSGLGRRLVAQLEVEARRLGFDEIALHARDTAVGFYKRLGYAIEGEAFVEVGIAHRRMTKRIT